MPTALSTLFCSEDDIKYVLSAEGVELRLDDDSSGYVESAESPRFLQARSYATTRVLAYCQPRYDTSELSTSWLVNEWATVVAAWWLCTRRGNPCPESIYRMMFGDGGADHGVMGDLRDVRAGKMLIPEIGTRNVDWPTWGNVRVDYRYSVRKLRVQRPLSEKTAAQSPQTIDRAADLIAPVEEW